MAKFDPQNIYYSVIVPAYRQEGVIVEDLENIYKTLTKNHIYFELICVVDGTFDQTFDQASALTQKYKEISVYGYPKNRGKGYAVRYGMAKSKGDVVGFIDAGMDINPQGLISLIDALKEEDSDIAIGSKKHPKSKVIYPLSRKIISVGYQLLVRVLFNFDVKDTQVGLKLYRREVLNKVLPHLTIDGFAFDIEMLALANRFGDYKIVEVPVDVNLAYGSISTISKFRMIRTILLMVKDTLIVFLRIRLRY